MLSCSQSESGPSEKGQSTLILAQIRRNKETWQDYSLVSITLCVHPIYSIFPLSEPLLKGKRERTKNRVRWRVRQYETTPLKCYWERGRSVFHRADKIIHLSLLSQPEAIRSTSPHIADRITQADPHWPLISAQYDGEWNVILYNIPVALKSHSYCKITTRLDYFGNVAVSLKC